MPPVPINYIAVLAAAAASIILGFVWYGALFGKQWRGLMGFTYEKMEELKARGVGTSYALMIIGALVMSYVLAHALIFASSYLNVSGATAGLVAGFWNWLGFIAPVTIGTVIWEGKPWRLWLLNNAYQLLSLLLMGIILAVWP